MITLPGVSSEMIANNIVPFEPTHPGEMLREELECRGITQTKLAAEIGIKVSLLNELINGKRDFTMEYAMLIEAALGIEADFWINLQTAYNKGKIRKDPSFMQRLANIRRAAIL
ncbi:MAG: HigA family addiction module antidote protein [Muribaculaceae bacterium]|nr:HigA family addiction module antidote protein [Muribaculaceae bacterium]